MFLKTQDGDYGNFHHPVARKCSDYLTIVDHRLSEDYVLNL